MSRYDLIVIGGGVSSYGFLKGLESSGSYKNKKIALIYPDKFLQNTENKILFTGSPKFLQKKNILTASYWESTIGEKFKQNNFSAVGVHGIGGMARIWGGSYGLFDGQSILKNNLNYDQLLTAYQACQNFLPLSGNKKDILSSYFKGLRETSGIKTSSRIKNLFGHYLNNNFIVSNPRILLELDKINKCIYCNQCLAGCHRDSVWYPQVEDFYKLNLNINITNSYVEYIYRDTLFWGVSLNNKTQSIKAGKIILGAGVIQNFKLLSRYLNINSRADIYNTPALAFAYLNLNKNKETDFFGMGNATFMANKNEDFFFYGNLYDGYSLAASSGKVFSSNKNIDKLFKIFANKIIAGAGFLSSENSNCEIKNYDTQISIIGKFSSTYKKNVKTAYTYLKKLDKKKFGQLIRFTKIPLGADIHYGGGIPDELKDKDLLCNGKLKNLDNILVVGGSTFEYLPPMSPTLSFIANSYKIGRQTY